MKKLLFLIFSFGLIVSLFGCNANKNENKTDNQETISPQREEQVKPGLVGYITKKDGESVLVVSPDSKDFSSTGGVKEYYDAVWVSGAPGDVEVGQKVKVWFKGPVAESYPALGGAEKVMVFSNPKPNEANLSQAQAISKALEDQKDYTEGIIIVKDAKYDAKSESWTIYMRKTYPENEFNVKIDDK